LKAVNKVRNRSTSFYAGHELENKVFQAFPVIQLQAGEEFARFFYSKFFFRQKTIMRLERTKFFEDSDARLQQHGGLSRRLGGFIRGIISLMVKGVERKVGTE
jgi:hypothetical protein